MSGTIPSQIGTMHNLHRFEMQENWLTGTIPDAFNGLPKLSWWDTYGNKMVGDLPPSTVNVTASLTDMYIQIEHTDVIRTYRCGERIPGLGLHPNRYQTPERQAGNKLNWYVQVAEYHRYKLGSLCVDPLSVEEAFYRLTDDV